MNIVAASYGMTLVAFAALTLLAALSWRDSLIGLRVLLGCGVIAIWAAFMILDALAARPEFLRVYVPELARNVALLWMLFGVAGAAIPRWFRRSCYVAAVLFLGFAVAQFAGVEFNGEGLLARSGLLFSFAGLAALEQTSRNARGNARSTLRYFVVGFGIVFAYDLFLYSQVELLNLIRADAWMARGIVDAMAAPLIAVAIRRNPILSIDIFVSRQAVFYTTTFLAVGVYLLFVAVGGYYVRNAGGTWGGVGQIFFFSGALIVLVSVLFSQSMRRRVKVFISKHFYRNKYDYRMEWLRFVNTLSNNRDDAIQQTALRALVETMSSSGGVLFTLDDSGKRFVPTAVWPESNYVNATIPDVDCDAECIHMLGDRQWIIDLKEYHRAPDVYQNIGLPAWLEQSHQFRIVSPILELDRLAGFVLLEDANPTFNLTYEDRDLLKTLGRHIATHLAQHDANRRLAESKQFDAYNRLTAFMMHDLKNAVAQLNLIVTNATRHKRNPQFVDDTIATIANASERMTRLIEQLKVGVVHAQNESLNVVDVVNAAITRCADRQPHAQLASQAAHACTVLANREQLTSILEHVIRNAQDATAPDRGIVVDVKSNGTMVEITVADDGAGMSLEFIRDRLFRPFDTTKGSRGMGIGAYQVREYLLSLGGTINVQSVVEKGTRFSLCIPQWTIK